MKTLLILILLSLWLIACALSAAVGFYFGKRKRRTPCIIPQARAQPQSEISRLKTQKELREYQNMLSYDGREQFDD